MPSSRAVWDGRASSELAAASVAAQTALPEREGPPLDHHFAAFVRSRRRTQRSQANEATDAFYK